jgi:DNA-binding transcriptional LysR family regulator
MDLHQLRCFVAAGEELHFGRAAQSLGMLPAAFGRFIRLLEEDLSTRLMIRTTRSVVLTDEGRMLLDEARSLLAQSDALAARIRSRSRQNSSILRIGAIDSAAAGLIPILLQDFKLHRSDVKFQLVEDKSIRLLPRLLSGSLDVAIIRPPEKMDTLFEVQHLFFETAVVALSSNHPLADRVKLTVSDLAEQPLIVPERRSRPHSHDLTMKLFTEAGLQATIAQVAEEKQTIINLVAAEIGIAIVPRWTSRMAVAGVRYVPLDTNFSSHMNKLPLAVAWLKGSRDPLLTDFLSLFGQNTARYSENA